MSRITSKEMPWSHWHERLHKKLLNNHKLLPKGSSLLLSVSGGQDSMALLKLFTDLQRLHDWKIHVWHGDHGWHNKSRKIAKELSQWCTKENLDFHCDHAIKEKTKTEKAAREWRYEYLVQRANDLSLKEQSSPCQHILTAHTSSDRAETFIMNLARGSDLTGLTSLREERLMIDNIQLVRPLLNFSRDETYKICEELKIPIWKDPTNEELIFKRNKVRQIVLPILEDMYKGCSLRITLLAERLKYYQEDQKALSLLAIQAIASKEGLCRQQLKNLPSTARATLLAKWLEDLGSPNISTKKIEALSKNIGNGKTDGQLHISKKMQITWSKKSVKLINKSN